MKCKCETTPELVCGSGSLVFVSRAVDLLEHVRVFCTAKLLKFSEFDGGVKVNVACADFFLRAFCSSTHISTLEKEEIKFVFLEKDRGISFADLGRLQSVLNYSKILDAGELLRILDEKRLTSFFQPIIDIKRQTISGYECLMRGLTEDGGIVSPGYLLGRAKDSELIHRLDREARETALRKASEKKVQGHLFINFIPTTIYEPGNCLRKTFQVIEELGIDRQRIVFEVVETEQVRDVMHLKGILSYYKDMGMKTALDDMGSGYSSLNLLMDIRPDFIKIDAGIVRNVHQDRLKQSLFSALCRAAADNGIKVLAEGVETREELDFIMTCRVDLVQGYFFARPAPEPVKDSTAKTFFH